MMKCLYLSLLALAAIALMGACGHHADEPSPDELNEPIIMPVDPHATWQEDTPMNNGAHGNFTFLTPPQVAPIEGLTTENFLLVSGER